MDEMKETTTETIQAEEVLELDYQYEDPDKQLEKEWQERTGLNTETLCGALETIVFMSDRPVSIQKLRDIIDPMIPLRVLHDSISALQERYENSIHGIRLQEVAEGYQFRTKATYSRFIQDYFKVNTLVLSPTALEVLALVAYRQPISRIEMDKIRGVDSSHVLRALMDRRLIKAVGRSEEMGRPVLYGTSAEFLEVFNLKGLDELPPEYELESMLDKNELGKISDIKTLVQSGEKDRFNFDDLEEIDQLHDEIKQISPDTGFIQTLKNQSKQEAKGGDVVHKSAFDLLEEYIEGEELATQNQSAKESDVLTSVVEANVIGDLASGPFNVPEKEDQLDELEEQEEELFASESELDSEIDKAFDELLGAGEGEFQEVSESEIFDEDDEEELTEREAALDAKNEEFADLAEGFEIAQEYLNSSENATESLGDEDKDML